MTYLFFYIIGLILIWYLYRVGWIITLKTIVSVVVPSFLIILFNLKTGKLLFRNPYLGIITVLPTAIFIFNGSKPLVKFIHQFIDKSSGGVDDPKDFIDIESSTLDE